jgi:hypothetical protein
MADQVSKKDFDALKTQVDILLKRFNQFQTQYGKDKADLISGGLEGDALAEKNAEAKVEPLRKAIADLTKRVEALE